MADLRKSRLRPTSSLSAPPLPVVHRAARASGLSPPLRCLSAKLIEQRYQRPGAFILRPAPNMKETNMKTMMLSAAFVALAFPAYAAWAAPHHDTRI